MSFFDKAKDFVQSAAEMTKDFAQEAANATTEAAKNVSGMVQNASEISQLKAKIKEEASAIEKCKFDTAEKLLQKFRDGKITDESLARAETEISARAERINAYNAEIRRLSEK